MSSNNKTLREPNSYANLEHVAVQHIDLKWTVDFDTRKVAGTAKLRLKVLDASVAEIVLDSKALAVESVLLAPDNEKLKFTQSPTHEAFGEKLCVALGERTLNEGDTLELLIAYSTTDKCTALAWLTPAQTAGKKHPYMFSQCQAIHARSLLPCQDTPAIKQTYTAEVTVPKPFTALVSALSTDEHKGVAVDGERTRFSFKQDVPIPSYLFALAVGELERREIGPRSAIWSEPSEVDKGAHEFADTERFVAAGEELLGPYVWKRYDMLLLPPSFPYGGMENPTLTFLTPTLIAGDRSLANVVCHEAAHSWTGNLVTNRTWEHFWLNEGFTVFVERKIVAKCYGEEYFDFQAIIGFRALKDSIEKFGEEHEFTKLVPKLDDQDPDDAFSSVPYEKGFNFLYYLQRLVGGAERFEAFLHAYIQEHQYRTVDTDDFRAYFCKHFAAEPKIADIDWDAWLYAPGMPPVLNEFDTTLVDAAERLAQQWISGGVGRSGADLDGWKAGQIIVFLDRLVEANDPLGLDVLYRIDQCYEFTASGNAEIRFRWYQLLIRSDYEQCFGEITNFLAEQGRMKFVRPLYRQLAKSKYGRVLALDTFKLLRDQYHAIAAKMIARDLEAFDGGVDAVSLPVAREQALNQRLIHIEERKEAVQKRKVALEARTFAVRQREQALSMRKAALDLMESELKMEVQRLKDKYDKIQAEKAQEKVDSKVDLTPEEKEKVETKRRSQFLDSLYHSSARSSKRDSKRESKREQKTGGGDKEKKDKDKKAGGGKANGAAKPKDEKSDKKALKGSAKGLSKTSKGSKKK